MDNFALMGGCGTSICLVIALLLFAGSRDNRQLARSAAPAVFFNINEILVYGLPIVLNPIMVIPFILTPLCSLLIAYGAAVSGFLPLLGETVTWTTPVFFSGYLSSGSWRGAAVQAVIVFVGTAIYTPFVKVSEQVRKLQAEMLQQELTEYLKEHQEAGAAVSLLERRDSMGILARNMASQLRIDVEEKNLTMGYQPQYDCRNRMAGAEALLRWRYMDEAVYPPLAVALAQEDGFLTG
ncbi:PTS transporter subunit EIIC [Blautia sp. RD014234]|nr:PTS transporter subunit EIIC [Blautia parvula]